MANNHTQAHAGGASRSGASGRGVVLMVDDDAAIAAMVAESLREEGYRVTCARSVSEAVEALARVRFDLVLADTPGVRMGGDHGWDRLEPLREAAGSTPMVLYTAHHGATVADLAAHGLREVPLKPFDLDELRAVVARLIPKPKPG
ncbi:MAG TPA: response regulator [Chloroflexota bacterium]|nr:response regulator [Chloroflexota bacterium]